MAKLGGYLCPKICQPVNDIIKFKKKTWKTAKSFFYHPFK
jgi:hypothetical protein